MVTEEQRPLLSVVRGDPTPEQLAALLMVLAAEPGAGTGHKPARRSRWGHPATLVRRMPEHGTDTWRTAR